MLIVVSWVRWHLAELTVLTAPTVLAVTVSPWWVTACALVAAGWVWHEARLTRALRGRRPPPPGSATTAQHPVDASSEDATA